MTINQVTVNKELVGTMLKLPANAGGTSKQLLSIELQPQGTQRVTLAFFDKQRSAAKVKDTHSLFVCRIMRRKDNKFNGLLITRTR